MKKIFIYGTFNVLHPGHQRLFRFAKELGGKLIVGVNSDRILNSISFFKEQYRLEGVKNNIWVDEVFILDEEVNDYLIKKKPDIVVKGREYENKFNLESETIKKYGGKLIFNSGEATFSSFELNNPKIIHKNRKINQFPLEFSKRHNINPDTLEDIILKFKKLKVCVFGDIIIDEYVICNPLGMSQEDPTIVVSPYDYKKFVGGAGIVSMHASSLGAKVDFFTVTGQDNSLKFAKSELKKAKVNSFISVDEKRPTTLKQRFQVDGKTLLRVSHLHQDSIDKSIQKKIFDDFLKNINGYDLIVFSDFNYGCLPQALVDKITKISLEKKIIIVADSQSSSQIGNVARFKNMDLITPTEHEARTSLRNYDDGLVVLAEKLQKKSGSKNIILKLGPEGILIHIDKPKNISKTDRIPALNKSPIDVAGAGDSMLITSSMATAVGADPWISACLGSVAAGIQISKLGNVAIKPEEIIREINI